MPESKRKLHEKFGFEEQIDQPQQHEELSSIHQEMNIILKHCQCGETD